MLRSSDCMLTTLRTG